MKNILAPVDITVKKIRITDILLYAVIALFSLLIFVMVIYFVAYILSNGLKGISWPFLTSAPNPREDTIGIFPGVINTLYIIFLSILFSVPVGVGGAVYINEYARNKKLIKIIEFTTETLSGIPSIIFGVFGYVFFCVMFDLKVTLLSGALTLAIIVLPVIMRTTQEALKAVPKSYRDAAMGMGATKWHMIRTVIIPSASGGIITAIILAVGRIIGESAALILVAGGSAVRMPKGNFFDHIMESGATLSVELFRYAYTRGDNETGFAIAAILLLIVIILNVSVKLISKRLRT